MHSHRRAVLTTAALIVVHAAVHFASLPLLRAILPPPFAERLDALAACSRVKLARLIRSTIYCAMALVVGTVLLSRARSLRDLAHAYTPLHEAAFEVALSHWLVSFVEDVLATSQSFVLRSARSASTSTAPSPWSLRSLESNSDATTMLWAGCLVHHAVAAAAFAFLLGSRTLGGMGALGLVYEGPVLLMNARELLIDFDGPLSNGRLLRALGGPTALRAVAALLHLLYVRPRPPNRRH